MRGLKTNQNDPSDSGKGAAATETESMDKSHTRTKQHAQLTATLRDITKPFHKHNNYHFITALNIKKITFWC